LRLSAGARLGATWDRAGGFGLRLIRRIAQIQEQFETLESDRAASERTIVEVEGDG
jgi:hypothetical protein